MAYPLDGDGRHLLEEIAKPGLAFQQGLFGLGAPDNVLRQGFGHVVERLRQDIDLGDLGRGRYPDREVPLADAFCGFGQVFKPLSTVLPPRNQPLMSVRPMARKRMPRSRSMPLCASA
jgi:hypothetical protein